MWNHNIDFDSEELSLIDSGIVSLTKVPLKSQLRGLNLHSNSISRIENLTHLISLRHLDLSSNQIVKIQGLDSLVQLRTLNLSCNLVEVVEGLQNLRSLVRLNLSYNQIRDLSGLMLIHGTNYKLSQLDVHGNKINSLQEASQCLVGCKNLRELKFQLDGSDNPICKRKDYRDTLLITLPKLQVLDGCDRGGAPIMSNDILADIPGLENYMEFLTSNDESINPIALATPQIDAALLAFQQRGVSTSEYSSTNIHTTTDPDTSLQESPRGTHRIQKYKREIKGKGVRMIPKRDKDDTEESEPEETRTQVEQTKRPISQPGRKKTVSKKVPQSRTKASSSNTTSATEDNFQVTGRKASRQTTPFKGTTSNAKMVPVTEGPTAVVEDERLRNEVQATYIDIMKELENERERRWKAEQAAKKLVDHIKELQINSREEKGLQDVAIQATTRLKEALTNEREIKVRMEAELELVKEELNQIKMDLTKEQKAEEEQRLALRAMKQTALQAERENLQHQAHEGRKLQEASMKAAATGREAEILKNQVKTLKGQLQQMQELLANREHDHRQDMSNRYALDSKELQSVIEKEVLKVEKAHALELKHQQQKIDVFEQQYNELEEEFRMALHLEADRFKELQEAYQKISREDAHNQQILNSARQKDEKTNNMITELSAIVKEQKGRIAELLKAKKEQTQDSKERIHALEAHLEEARRRMVQLELFKQEKNKLQAQVQAQESVIEGLRTERKLWGEELAQQGSSLAQDRGRLESKIETLSLEVNSLKKQLEREADAVKIKTKILEDQTETIRKLKEGVLERDEEIKQARNENLKIQKDLEDSLGIELSANQDIQERLDRARERKDELKQQIGELQEELQQSKKAHSVLNDKWKQKSGLISQLEQQVTQMKNTWENKEIKLTQERDKAIDAARIAVNKIKTMDEAFRKQIDLKESSKQEALDRLAQEKQEETDYANQRVAEVEEEMRELLRETEIAKRHMENKVKKLNKAFSDLQHDLF